MARAYVPFMRLFQTVLILATFVVATPAQSQTDQDVAREAVKVKASIDASFLPADLKPYLYQQVAENSQKGSPSWSMPRLMKVAASIPLLEAAYNEWASMVRSFEKSPDSPPRIRAHYLAEAQALRARDFPRYPAQANVEVEGMLKGFDSYMAFAAEIRGYIKEFEADGKIPPLMRSQTLDFLNLMVTDMRATPIANARSVFEGKKAQVAECRVLIQDFNQLEDKVRNSAVKGLEIFTTNTMAEIAQYRANICNPARSTVREAYTELRNNYEHRAGIMVLAAQVLDQLRKLSPQDRVPYQARLDFVVATTANYRDVRGKDRTLVEKLWQDVLKAPKTG